MIVERGELIDTGRRFPAEDLVGVAGAEECFVGKPVEFPGASKISQLEVVGLGGLSCPMTRVNVHKTKAGSGKPVADLVPHRTEVSMEPDKKLGAIAIHYDPIEKAPEEDWPSEVP
jgi:hypothetical protein